MAILRGVERHRRAGFRQLGPCTTGHKWEMTLVWTRLLQAYCCLVEMIGLVVVGGQRDERNVAMSCFALTMSHRDLLQLLEPPPTSAKLSA
jgi:hypothetical protein